MFLNLQLLKLSVAIEIAVHASFRGGGTVQMCVGDLNICEWARNVLDVTSVEYGSQFVECVRIGRLTPG